MATRPAPASATTPPPADPPPAEPTTPDDHRASIREVLAEELGKLFTSGKATVTDETPAAEPGIAEQVRQAVRDVNAEQQEISTVNQLVSDVNTLKAAAQRPPAAVRSVERFMGWRRDDE